MLCTAAGDLWGVVAIPLRFARTALRRSRWQGFALAALLYLLAVGARPLFGLQPGSYPFLTFFPAVLLSAYFAGTRPAVLCALASFVTAWYFYIPPLNSFGLERSVAPALGLFAFISIVIIFILDLLTRTAERLEAEQRLSQDLIEQQQTMFAELQHRVANNLGFLRGMLTAQRKQIAADPSLAPALLDETMARLDMMGRLHRRLHKPTAVEQPLPQYLQELCSDLLEATGARNIVCLVDADDVRLDLTKLTAMSLLVAELMTNSLKHAFHGAETGTISINLKQLPDGLVGLDVTDSGPGMPPRARQWPAQGLGHTIIRGLASQLGGDLRMPRPGSSTFGLTFPAASAARS